ncbi:MAG TPA: hypothetical protein VGL24_01255 [Chthoniobacterales bacterium]|jgi:hypothetical protein
MRLLRRWFQPTAKSCTHEARRWSGLQPGRALGAILCALAIFLSSGSHWAVLQSVAYTRMVVQFAQKDPLCTAVRKAFDGQHSCSLCPKIRDGYNKQRKVPQTVNVDRLPEFVALADDALLFTLTRGVEVSIVGAAYTNFSPAPPTPPPRVV